jgi:hypothetical protein
VARKQLLLTAALLLVQFVALRFILEAVSNYCYVTYSIHTLPHPARFCESGLTVSNRYAVLITLTAALLSQAYGTSVPGGNGVLSSRSRSHTGVVAKIGVVGTFRALGS